MTAVTIISDQRYQQHNTGNGDHPEVPDRLNVILRSLEVSKYSSVISYQKPRIAEREWLLTAHNESWLFRFEEAVLSGKTYIDHSDNQVGYESYDIAMLAAGAGLNAIDLIESNNADNVLCLVRPPGHHAEAKNPFGFCFFNNCVIAARYWQLKYGRKRVLVFDFDAHHGNGIQSALEEEADGLYVSIHEHPSFSYPGTGYVEDTGIGEGKGTIVNIPLSPGADDNMVIEKLEQVILPRLMAFQPEAIIVAAGFDGHKEDYMSGLQYSTELYFTLGVAVQSWAKRFTGGKLLSILEGGYELSVLGDSVAAYVNGLVNE